MTSYNAQHSKALHLTHPEGAVGAGQPSGAPGTDSRSQPGPVVQGPVPLK